MRRRRLALWVPALCAVLFAAAPDARAAGRNLTGTQAPDLYVQQGLFGLDTGATLYQFRGHVIALKFFFTECPACRQSLPDFQRQYAKYSGRGVQFIAVAYDSADRVRSMWSRSGYSVPVAIDENGVNSQRYGVSSYPTNYLIGGDGVVRSYDDISDWTIERELARSGAAPTAPVGVGASFRTTGSAPSSTSNAERNVRELGSVPSALSAVTNAAADNDYGLVLRIVEPHLKNPVAEQADVLTAARRIEKIAQTRYQNRLARIDARRVAGDKEPAYQALARMVEDFRGTQYEATLVALATRWRAELGGAGGVAAR